MDDLPADLQTELHALLTLRFTPGLGPHRIEALRQRCGGAQAVLSAPLAFLRSVPGLDSKTLAQLGAPQASAQAHEEMRRARVLGVRLLGRGLSGYPAGLEALGDPPAVLWVKGPRTDNNNTYHLPQEVVPRAVGLVGTRAPSEYAVKFTRQLAADLARAEVNVVSGLARGIDTAAHASALDAGGHSTALLGCGVDVVYPAENAHLAQRLTLVSEYPLGTRPAAHHFPQRNRLIAALSAGSVIVEGELKSGSLITATHALECGRTVFAVPGRAQDPNAAGPHRLLREGAALCESAADILEELGWAPPAGPAPADPAGKLPPEQARVYAALPPLGGALMDDLPPLCGLSYAETQLALMTLQLAGLVEEQGGRYLRR